MKRDLDVTNLEIECEADGSTKVTVWCKCWKPEDIEDVIAWLGFAKAVMEQWEFRRKVGP